MKAQKTFTTITRQYFYPELKVCPHCGWRLKIMPGLHSQKTVQTLNGVLWTGGYAAQCPNPECTHRQVRYTSVKLAQLSLPHVTYGLDVIVRVGWRRQHDHRTMSEIGQELRGLSLQITDREVERLWDYYRALLHGLSQADRHQLREAERQYGGLIWSADGLEPESGQPQLWVVREALTGRVVRAEWLTQVNEATLKVFLHPVKALGFKTLATLSDQQPALVKTLKAVWHTPHQACQSHFIRDAAKSLVDTDRAWMVDIKAKIRGIRAIERQIEDDPPDDRRASVIRVYILALRQGLRFRSRAPFRFGGLRLYDLLTALASSIRWCLKKGAMHAWPRYCS